MNCFDGGNPYPIILLFPPMPSAAPYRIEEGRRLPQTQNEFPRRISCPTHRSC